MFAGSKVQHANMDGKFVDISFADLSTTDVESLLRLLTEGTPGAKANSAGALRNLAMNTAHQVLIATVRGIETLVSLLTEGTPDAKGNSAGALRRIAANADNHLHIAEAGGVEAFVRLLTEHRRSSCSCFNLLVPSKNHRFK